MADRVPFVRILALLEEHGWEFTRIKRPFRVFTRKGRSPIIVKVVDGTVDAHDEERIKGTIKDQGEEDRA